MKKSKADNLLKKDIDNEKVKKVAMYFASFFIPSLIICGVFLYLKVFPFGNSIYTPIDCFGQYIPFLGYFKSIFEGQESIFYSLGKSIGGEMYGLFAYYLLSPYNLIALILEKARIAFAFNIIIVIKTASLGPAFYYLLSRKGKDNWTNLIFSSMYALSSVAISYGFNIMWLDSMILLPLVIAGLEDLIKEKKPFLYTITLTLTLITNYYMGFMVCIFIALYFIYKLILENLNPKKEIIKKIGRVLLFSLIAVMIAGIILVPVLIGLRDGRTEYAWANFNFNKNFEMQDVLSKFFTNAFSLKQIDNTAMPPLFCGMFANFLVLLYFMNSKIKLKEKILSGIFLLIFYLSFYINAFNILWVMGNTPAFYIYRYAFCYSFMFILIASKGFENIKEGTKTWNVIVATLIYEIIGFAVLKFNLGVADHFWVKADMCLAVIFGIIIEFSRIDFKESKNKILNILKKNNLKIASVFMLILSMANLIINTGYSMGKLREDGMTNTMNDYAFLSDYYDEKYKKLSEYDNEAFRIASNMKLSYNDGLAFGFNGMNVSTSTYSKRIYEFLDNLGFSQEHVIVANDTGNTKAMDMFFGIKYKMQEEEGYEEIKVDDKINVYKSPGSLKLGFAVSDSVLKDLKVKERDAFAYQNDLLKNVSNLDKDIFEKHEGRVETITENLNYDSGKYTKSSEEDAILKYEFTSEQNKDVYLYLGFGYNFEELEFYVNGQKIDKTFVGNFNKLLYLGKFDIGEKVSFEIKPTCSDFGIYFAYIYYENNDVLNECYDILSKDQMNLYKVKGNEYKGDINIESDNEYVMFTIPFDKGWTAFVDGEERDIIRVQGELMAIKTGNGEHTITLKYVPIGFKLGAAVSLIRYPYVYMCRCFL